MDQDVYDRHGRKIGTLNRSSGLPCSCFIELMILTIVCYPCIMCTDCMGITSSTTPQQETPAEPAPSTP